MGIKKFFCCGTNKDLEQGPPTPTTSTPPNYDSEKLPTTDKVTAPVTNKPLQIVEPDLVISDGTDIVNPSQSSGKVALIYILVQIQIKL
ncbi:8312_t:CDS:2 [Funneliformis mosseae]|uniref:8312_t:CDS:1 n=1 Tax=Funneliformis mosseae TaxID=27381 RepID=A0A9N9EBL2_FUNMO|nr:8312_t:CDS:2 [Funneliformis mosseae]